MTFYPIGFTSITSDFSAYRSPPSVFGSINQVSDVFSGDLVSFIASSFDLDVATNSIVFVPETASLNLQTSASSSINSSVVNLTASLSIPGVQDLSGYVVSIGVVSISCIGGQSLEPPLALTDEFGRANFSARFSNPSDAFCFASVVATLGANPNIQSPPVKINVAPNTVVSFVELPIIPGIPKIPQQELGFAALSDALEQITILEEINLSPTQETQEGSKGDSAYNSRRMLSPKLANLDSTLSWAIKSIQGFGANQARRHKTWSENVLHDVHSPSSEKENSEFKVLSKVLPLKGILCHSSYGQFVQDAGKFSATANTAFLPDYAEGHQVKKTNANEHIICDQYRVQASSSYLIDAATINVASQQYVNQSRYMHGLSDIHQETNQHYWCRSEKQHVTMANCLHHYADEGLFNFSPYTNDNHGSRFLYSDEEYVQIGNIAGQTLHKTKVTSRYGHGQSTKYVQNDYKVIVGDGPLRMQAAYEVNIRAGTGVYIHAENGVAQLNSDDVLVLRGKVLGYLSAGILNIKATEVLNLDAPIVNINSGLAQLPIVFELEKLVEIPSVPKQMESPPPLNKEAPNETQKKSQSTPQNPTPYSNLGGPDFQQAVRSSPIPLDSVMPSTPNDS